ncbi:MAG: alpha/beta hydrolase [Actinomycetota bacterium]
MSGKVGSDGEEIYYESIGDGSDTVVFCHGLGGNHAVWFQQVPVFAEHFRVVTWDQRGFGMSTNKALASGPDAAAVDLAALLDHLDIGRAHLVGQSMGGWAIVRFALKWPDRVHSLVLADSIGGIVDATVDDILAHAVRRSVPVDEVGRHAAIADSLVTEDPAKAFLYQQLGGFRGQIDQSEMFGKLGSARYSADDVRLVDLPALCIVGSQDDLMPPQVMRHVASILGASCVEVAGAGHSPYFERPAEWNEAVLDFLNGVASS